MSKNKLWIRAVTCPDCNQIRNIRKDQSRGQNSVICKKCNTSKLANENRGIRPKTGSTSGCKFCNLEFYKPPSSQKSFCSKACHDQSRLIYKKETKNCGSCGACFLYGNKPFSNSVGRYCSLKCRNNSYFENAVRYGHRNHRPRWASARKEFVKSGNDFCSSCGLKDVRLEVHHVIPYRICKNNEKDNLVALCHPCHSKYEKYSLMISKLPKNKMELGAAIIHAHLADLWHLHKGLSLNAQHS